MIRRILILIFAVSSMNVFADMGEGTRGGADDIGLEFQSMLNMALIQLKSMPDLHAKIKHLKLESLYKPGGARAITIDEVQKLRIDGKEQDCVATSDWSDNITRITRGRWKEIVSIRLKMGIALHEALVLKKLEFTGQYPISGKFLANLGLDPSALISGNPLPSTLIGKVMTIHCKFDKPWRISGGDRVKELYLVYDGKIGIQDPTLVLLYNTDMGLPAMGPQTEEFRLDSDTPKNIQYRPIPSSSIAIDLLQFDFANLKIGLKGRGKVTLYAEPKRGFNVIRPVYDLQCQITDAPPEI